MRGTGRGPRYVSPPHSVVMFSMFDLTAQDQLCLPTLPYECMCFAYPIGLQLLRRMAWTCQKIVMGPMRGGVKDMSY
jgi:hypothetical protein